MSQDPEPETRPGSMRGLKCVGAVLLAAVMIAGLIFRDDVLRASLDPKTPFQTYRPPAAPDYSRRASWALLPADPVHPASGDPPADVFFIHPTTYNGGEEWNGPIDYPRAARQLEEVMLPNYAGPFAKAGRVFAPRYRQASVYAMVSQRDDAREARDFAYGDVEAAFRLFLERFNGGRPLIIVGTEQGGALAARLLRDEVAKDPALAARLAAAYFIQTIVPADDYGPGAAIPACLRRDEARCVVAYAPVTVGHYTTARRVLQRALVWGPGGEIVLLGQRKPLCINPLAGKPTSQLIPDRENLGAANATKLEWGLRPAFLPHEVSAQCANGLLWVSRPKSPVLKPSGAWVDRLKPPNYNLFYADLEADSEARLNALLATPGFHAPAPPITTSIEVRKVPLMGR
jgi:hypothetical protein